MNKYVIILAAGKGTQMQSVDPNHSKVSYPILDKPMIKCVLDTVKQLEPAEIVTVVGFGGELTSRLVRDDSKVVWQDKILGTGHAVKQTSEYLKDKKGLTLIMYGDTPLVSIETLNEAFHKHIKGENALTIVSAVLEDPSGYGRIIRQPKSNKVLAIRENKDCTLEEAEITEVNTGICIIDNELLFANIDRITQENNAGLFYLSQLVEIFVSEGKKVDSYVARNRKEVFGIINRANLAEANMIMRNRINHNHMLNGVSIEDPSSTYISPDVKIGRDTIIRPNTSILGNTVIGEANIIGPNVYMVDCIVGDNNKIRPSWLKRVRIEDRCEVKPFLTLENCKVDKK